MHYIDFGIKTVLDLNDESSGILFKYENINPVKQTTMSFGQGISVNVYTFAKNVKKIKKFAFCCKLF